MARYRAEPALPTVQPVMLTNEAFGSVPRAYLFATNDRAITRSFQAAMVETTPVAETAELATSHSPFLSQPTETADAIEALAD